METVNYNEDKNGTLSICWRRTRKKHTLKTRRGAKELHTKFHERTNLWDRRQNSKKMKKEVCTPCTHANILTLCTRAKCTNTKPLVGVNFWFIQIRWQWRNGSIWTLSHFFSAVGGLLKNLVYFCMHACVYFTHCESLIWILDMILNVFEDFAIGFQFSMKLEQWLDIMWWWGRERRTRQTLNMEKLVPVRCWIRRKIGHASI